MDPDVASTQGEPDVPAVAAESTSVDLRSGTAEASEVGAFDRVPAESTSVDLRSGLHRHAERLASGGIPQPGSAARLARHITPGQNPLAVRAERPTAETAFLTERF